ncbi:hypothetical protein AC579_7546 [Pseudocercospora musae]|uniref:Uncharacterized protein n=1 Tax=Pseudocercospora musae TaxID=113226 RepID=A0A139IHJ7_9PEZI|nr:hypothetical protein AC579_7546 [Pseudocercospora musae]
MVIRGAAGPSSYSTFIEHAGISLDVRPTLRIDKSYNVIGMSSIDERLHESPSLWMRLLHNAPDSASSFGPRTIRVVDGQTKAVRSPYETPERGRQQAAHNVRAPVILAAVPNGTMLASGPLSPELRRRPRANFVSAP